MEKKVDLKRDKKMRMKMRPKRREMERKGERKGMKPKGSKSKVTMIDGIQQDTKLGLR